jgi:hypothetical protein
MITLANYQIDIPQLCLSRRKEFAISDRYFDVTVGYGKPETAQRTRRSKCIDMKIKTAV